MAGAKERYDLLTPDRNQFLQRARHNAMLTIPATLIFFGLGTALFVFYNQHPDRLGSDLKNDAIFPFFIVRELPAGIAGIVIAGIFLLIAFTCSIPSAPF